MNLWLLNKWEDVRTSFWFIPSLLVVSSIALSLVTIHLDRELPYRNWVAKLGWTFTRGPEGSRAVLSVVAGSMMTIASVTFSITIVALQLASSQFGPRLLRNFMRDRGNQISIGTFIATFTYCLLILRTINGTEEEQFVPHISVTVGLLLALASLAVMIYFIHHAAESIQAENVIAAVNRDMHRAIDRLYPEELGKEPPQPRNANPEQLPTSFDREARSVSSPRSDYLQAIDVERLIELAQQNNIVICLEKLPGKFCFKGAELARVWPTERLDGLTDAIVGNFYFGSRRSLVQDVEFAIDQLVEVAVRALSPGVNDPFTAITCIDRLGAALSTLSEKVIPSPYRYDDEGHLRVVTDSSTVSGIIDAAFSQIRQAGRNDASVTLRLLETIIAVGRHTHDPAFRTALRRHAEAIHRGSEDAHHDPIERQDAEIRYQEAIRCLDGTPTASTLTSQL